CATVSNAAGSRGLVTTHAFGHAQITAALRGVHASTPLTVTLAMLVSIEITPPDQSLAVGLIQEYTATGHFSDSSTQHLSAEVGWGVSDQAVALISRPGVLRARAVGHVQISAQLHDLSATTNLTVTPVAPVSVSIQPVLASVPAGFARQFTAVEAF